MNMKIKKGEMNNVYFEDHPLISLLSYFNFTSDQQSSLLYTNAKLLVSHILRQQPELSLMESFYSRFSQHYQV